MLKQYNRLKKTPDFMAAYKQGKYVVAKEMVIYYLPRGEGLRVGFVVSKKVGPSYVRSRCKRLLRESMRSLLPDIADGYDLVVVARPPLAGKEYHRVSHTMQRLLRKAKLLKGQ